MASIQSYTEAKYLTNGCSHFIIVGTNDVWENDLHLTPGTKKRSSLAKEPLVLKDLLRDGHLLKLSHTTAAGTTDAPHGLRPLHDYRMNHEETPVSIVRGEPIQNLDR